MLIRCEKCSTLYELDDKLIPAGGAPVQCTKCQFVFRAYPPPPEERAASAGTPVPAAPAPQRSAPPRGGERAAPPPSTSSDAPPAEPQRSSPALRAPASAPGPDAKFTPDGRPIRKVPFPEDESTAGGPGRSAIGRAPARPSIPVKPRSGAPRWVLPVVVAALVLAAAAYAGWRVLSRRGKPGALAPAVAAPTEVLAMVARSPLRGSAGPTPGNVVAHAPARRGARA